MTDLVLPISLMWIAEIFYIVSLILGLIGIIFKKEALIPKATAILVLGFIFQGVSLGLRWYSSGHAPYSKVYEVFSSDIFIALAIYLFVTKYYRSLEILGTFVLPICIPVLGWAIISDPAITPLPPTFKSMWLVVHILFAKLAFGSVLIAFGVGVLFLLKEKNYRGLNIYQRIPDLERLDLLSSQFVAFGFVFTGLMIAAGAIWANESWGRYWNWDAIETWSLFTWFLYGIFLHLRVTFNIQGRLSQLMIVGILIFSLLFNFGTTYIIPTIHSIYLQG